MSKKKLQIAGEDLSRAFEHLFENEDNLNTFIEKFKKENEELYLIGYRWALYNSRLNPFHRFDLALILYYTAELRLKGAKINLHEGIQYCLWKIYHRQVNEYQSWINYHKAYTAYETYLHKEIENYQMHKGPVHGFEYHPFNDWKITARAIVRINALVAGCLHFRTFVPRSPDGLPIIRLNEWKPAEDFRLKLLNYKNFKPEVLEKAKLAKANSSPKDYSIIFLTPSVLSGIQKDVDEVGDVLESISQIIPVGVISGEKLVDGITTQIEKLRLPEFPAASDNVLDYIELNGPRQSDSAKIRILYICLLHTHGLLTYDEYDKSRNKSDFEKYVDREARRILGLPVK